MKGFRMRKTRSTAPKSPPVRTALTDEQLTKVELESLVVLRAQTKEIAIHSQTLRDKLGMFVALVGPRYFKEGTVSLNNEGQLEGESKDSSTN